MDAEDVLPHIRHWVEVHVADADEPAYRGLLLWQREGVSVVVNGHSANDGSRMTTRPVAIADIRNIVALNDPAWLVASNKAASVLRAQGILYSAQGGGEG
jgi:hypothetical protein